MSLLPWMLLAFAVALAGTWLARSYALRNALVDEPDLDAPDPRRSHAVPTPRGGGVAIVVALLPALGWLVLHPEPASRRGWLAIAGGLLLVAGIGWLDDHRPLGAAPRLFVHALAAGLLALALHWLGADPMMAAAAFGLALVLVNAWNFMDGIDSLATSQALLAALAYALFAGSGPVLSLGAVLAAACAGFLPFNLPRARVFLGDVGSGALGFMLAVLVSLLLL